MLHIIAFLSCTLGMIVQWRENWELVSICALFATGNLYFAVDWIKHKVKSRRASKQDQ